jgi:hypothetical protein
MVSSSMVFTASVIVLIGALTVAAHLLGVPPVLIGLGLIAAAALSLLTALSRRHRPEPPAG